MIANWVKVLGLLIGGTAAAAAAAYVGGVFEPSRGSAPIEAAVQQPPAGQSGQGKEAPADEAASADVTVEGEEQAAEGGETATEEEQQVASLPREDEQPESTAPTAEPDVIVPTFDIVRVEPDGSMVIAGAATPNADVELLAGTSVIGTAKAGPTGDFAVVLDDPLAPGDYTVVLRSTGEDDVVATSAQTAIVSVPETVDGQLLALVEEPGEPSRLITVPTAPAAETEVASADTQTEGAEPAEAAAETEMAEADPATEAEAPGEQMAAVDDGVLAGGDETPEAAAEAAEAEGAESTETMQAAAAEEPATTDNQMAAQDGPPEAGTEELAGSDAAESEETQVAAAQPADTEEETAPVPQPRVARVAVEAVEIEGRKVFVAGRSEAGTTVRVYANDILLGQAVTSEGGRFLIETEKDLPVGDYIVRADMLSADKADVVARAAVPFEREPGERIAAVASPEPTAPAQETEPADVASDAAQPAPQTASSDTPNAATEAGEATTEASDLAGGVAAADNAETEAEGATDVAAADSGGNAPEAAAASDEIDVTEANDAASGVEEAEGTEVAAASEAVEATAPKLQSVGGAVIIRRGDTLWRLSRRVYGRGVRYTTIYLANQEQIADPDRIWPGQVFSVPSETGEGEAADMSAVAEQVADPEAESDDIVTR